MRRVAAVKPGCTVEDAHGRARATLEPCLVNGTMVTRTQVEVDPNVGLRGFEALCRLARDYAWAIDIELCAFAQEGWTNAAEVDANALIDCGVDCSLSTNNVLNPFTPFGDCSLVRVANLYANTVQLGAEGALAECFEMLTRRSARLLRRADYGIAVGNPADLVVWDAPSAAQAIATVAPPLYGFKRGRRTFTRAPAELRRP